MNFLSHYFVSSVKLNPVYNAGLILPDLLRNHIRQFHEPNVAFSTHVNQLLTACHQHQTDDKKFHGSIFFTQLLDHFLKMIKQHPTLKSLPRKWFVAHISLEMLLDRILIKHFPKLIEEFYADLNQLNSNLLLDFIALHGIENPQKIIDRWNQFKKAKYIGNYPCNQLFSYSIWRIMTNIGIQDVDRNDVNEWVELLQKLEESFFLDRYSLIFELKHFGK